MTPALSHAGQCLKNVQVRRMFIAREIERLRQEAARLALLDDGPQWRRKPS